MEAEFARLVAEQQETYAATRITAWTVHRWGLSDVEEEDEKHHVDNLRRMLKSKSSSAKELVVIVAVGGDGTGHTVVNQLFFESEELDSLSAPPHRVYPHVRYCLVPGGTGCDFARLVPCPRSAQELFDTIVNHEQRTIMADVGVIRYQPLLSLDEAAVVLRKETGWREVIKRGERE